MMKRELELNTPRFEGERPRWTRALEPIVALMVASGCGSPEGMTPRHGGNQDDVVSEPTAADPASESPTESESTTTAVSAEPVEIRLGALPDGFDVALPIPPRITHAREVSTAPALQAALAEGNVRVTFRGRAQGRVVVEADDVQLLMAEGAFIERLSIARGTSRVHVRGGHFGAIELAVPARFGAGEPEYREAWKVSDVALEQVEVETNHAVGADDTAFFLRGTRIALVRSRARAQRCAVWSGDMGPFVSEDLVVSESRFDAAGPEATVRLVGVERAAVVDNVLSNTRKHDFRVHGRSDRVLFARNRLLETGVMIGTMPGDAVGSIWVLDNTFHHRSPSLFLVSPTAVTRLVARGNRAYSDVVPCFVCVGMPAAWEVSPHEVTPYRPPPP